MSLVCSARLAKCFAPIARTDAQRYFVTLCDVDMQPGDFVVLSEKLGCKLIVKHTIENNSNTFLCGRFQCQWRGEVLCGHSYGPLHVDIHGRTIIDAWDDRNAWGHITCACGELLSMGPGPNVQRVPATASKERSNPKRRDNVPARSSDWSSALWGLGIVVAAIGTCMVLNSV